MSNWPQISLSSIDGYTQCFGCGKDNPIGLKLNLKPDGKGLRAEFTPGEQFQGWPGYLHGGITACILDEAMSNTAGLGGLRCITAKLETRFIRLVPINEPLVVTAAITRKTRKVIQTAGKIHLKDGSIAAEATGTHFVANNN
ncbi:MAG: hypothetical protein JW856_04820 [Dehalococcoidales bacterium]|nr:hypothetical protein [Dehalococcoidales bacterium]